MFCCTQEGGRLLGCSIGKALLCCSNLFCITQHLFLFLEYLLVLFFFFCFWSIIFNISRNILSYIYTCDIYSANKYGVHTYIHTCCIHFIKQYFDGERKMIEKKKCSTINRSSTNAGTSLIHVKVEWFERTHEENEELGLNDMNTDDFETLPEGYVRPPIAAQGEGGGKGGGGTAGEGGRGPSHLIPHRVGTDHPTAFTKGQEEEDNTVTDGGGL